MTGMSKKAVSRLLVEAGTVATEYQDAGRWMRNFDLPPSPGRSMCGFCYAKERNVTAEIAAKVRVAGSIWLWVAVDADTKIVPWVMLGATAPRLMSSHRIWLRAFATACR